MAIPNVSLNDSVKIQNNPTAVKQNTASINMKSPEDLQRQPQEDNFNGKGLDKKKIITYASIGTVLTTLVGIALDFRFAEGKHVKNLWRKLTGNAQDIKPKSNETTNVNGKADVNTPNIPDKPDVVQPKTNVDVEPPKADNIVHENKSEIDKQVKEFFEQEEKELAEIKEAKKLSDLKNEEWVREQHHLKEKEYSNFWNRTLEEEEKYNRVDFDVKIDDTTHLGNNIDLDLYLGKFKQSKYTREALQDCKDLTFDSPNLKLLKDRYNLDNIYDLGLRYAIVANNTAKVRGNSTLIREIPEIFRGIDEQELVSKLDVLPSLLKSEKINTFTIGGKKFQAELIGSGCLNDVYKITDSANNQICYKYARDPYLMNGGQGFYNEFAILNEANKAGVVDVPKLYMGNPVGCYAYNPNYNGGTTKGAWEIVELVEPNTSVPSGGLMLEEWLKSLRLYHGDLHSGNSVGDKIVDLGGIIDKAKTVYLIRDEAKEIFWLLKAYKNGKTSKEIIEYIDKYSK